MKKLELNVEELIAILKIQSESDSETEMRNHIVKKVGSIEGTTIEVDDSGNVIVEKGNAKLKACVCSHIDTVHSYSPSFRLTIEGNRISATPVGVGGDDKCGIYTCIELLKHCDNLKAIFFSQEEIHCVGSSAIDLRHFDNCKCLIEIDRRNASDLITSRRNSRTVSNEFMDDIRASVEDFGYVETQGFNTDVFTIQSRIAPKTLSAINVSCGYYNPHTNDEYILTDELENSVNFVKSVIDSLKDTVYTL
jgi:putative aminopeptidase FrvX